MRLQLIAASLALAASAHAQPAPAPAAPPVAPASQNPDTIRSEDVRDVLDDPTPAVDPDASEPATGTARIGLYHDSDKTDVERFVGLIGRAYGKWRLDGSVGVDAVTSASVDVRASPALSKVDVVTSASGRSSTSGGQMTDSRYQVTGGAGWKDTDGHSFGGTAAAAKETDYASMSGAANGSYDILDRTTTLLGGGSITDSWVSSVLDPTLHRKLFAASWSAGIARVVTRDDAVRVHYDGRLAAGDQSSPYRRVRFGDWTAMSGEHQIVFTNTIGSADGLAERLPQRRYASAAVIEWVHSLASGVGLHPEVRLGHDSWNIGSVSAAVDLRIARPTWRLRVGYRFYLQSSADFFHDKYVDAPQMYDYYASDKELGEQIGHMASFDLATELLPADGPNDHKLMFTLQLDAVHYRYPGFELLPTRDSVFIAGGLAWEL